MSNVARRALLLVPRRLELVASGRAAKATRTVYRPGKRLGMLARELAIVLPVGRRDPGGPSWPTVLEALGIVADGYAAIKSTGRSQWVAAVEQNGRVIAVVKVATGSQINVLREEMKASARGADAAAGNFRVPRVLGSTVGGSYFAVAAEPAPQSTLRFDLEQALGLAIALANAPSGPVLHGDLVPWNILGSSDVWLIDWEMAVAFRPGVDFAHYVLASAHIGALIGVDIADRILNDEQSHLTRYAAATGVSIAVVRNSIAEYRREFFAQHGAHS